MLVGGCLRVVSWVMLNSDLLEGFEVLIGFGMMVPGAFWHVIVYCDVRARVAWGGAKGIICQRWFFFLML